MRPIENLILRFNLILARALRAVAMGTSSPHQEHHAKDSTSLKKCNKLVRFQHNQIDRRDRGRSTQLPSEDLRRGNRRSGNTGY